MTKYIDRYYLNGELYGIKFGGEEWQPKSTALAWYQLNGNLNDTLGNYNMTEGGTVVYSTGDLGNQAYFDNISYGVVMGNVGRTGESSITIAVTYKAENDGYIIASWEYGGWMLQRNAWMLRTTNSDWIKNINPAYDGNWHCGVVTYDGAKFIGYLDGSKVSEIAVTGDIMQYSGSSSDRSMAFGANRQPGGYLVGDKYNGYIHEAVIDSEPRTLEQVQEFTAHTGIL